MGGFDNDTRELLDLGVVRVMLPPLAAIPLNVWICLGKGVYKNLST